MNSIWQRIENEPALIGGLVTAGFAVATAYGLHETAGQTSAILGVVGLVTSLFVRANVTATATPDNTPQAVTKALATAAAIKAAAAEPVPVATAAYGPSLAQPDTVIGGVVEPPSA